MNEKKQQVESFPWHIWEQHEGNQRFRSAAGRPGRIISGRLLPGCDILLGIIEMARSHEVRSAWVNAFGSLARAAFSPGIQLSAAKPDRVERRPNVNLPGPIEMWSGMGRLSIPDKGEPFIHFHGLVVTPEGQLYGGHFFSGNNIVYATFEVHIQEILGVEFRLEKDETVELALIEPKENV
ncbi:MAG: DNA-binding protein [Deltaproteobacteria bacterium]|nr:MAG: DNA-binding protein [Deltaproteobacteria bacterium]